MKTKKIITSVCTAAVFASLICMPAYAASGDVAGAIEGTWQTVSDGLYMFPEFPALLQVLRLKSYQLPEPDRQSGSAAPHRHDGIPLR